MLQKVAKHYSNATPLSQVYMYRVLSQQQTLDYAANYGSMMASIVEGGKALHHIYANI